MPRYFLETLAYPGAVTPPDHPAYVTIHENRCAIVEGVGCTTGRLGYHDMYRWKLSWKAIEGGAHPVPAPLATQNLFDAVWRDFYGRTSMAGDLDQLTTCYCSTCTEFGQVVSVRSRRRHEAIKVKKEAERLKDGRGSEETGQKPPISVFLEDENDCRNGPIIGNGASSNEWTRIGFTAAVLKIRADNPGVSQGCITDMFCLFKRVLDDHGIENSVPESYREAKSLVNDILPKSRTYHACPNGCVLFVGEYENATTCPKCKGSRFYSETNKPYKEYEYFSIVDSLRTLFGIPEVSKLLQAHVAKLKAEPPKLVSDIQQTEKWREMYSPEGIYKPQSRQCGLRMAADGPRSLCLLLSRHSPGLFQNSDLLHSDLDADLDTLPDLSSETGNTRADVIDILLDMGFSLEDATIAEESCDGSVEDAVDWLDANKTSDPANITQEMENFHQFPTPKHKRHAPSHTGVV
ncbi:hypothetical protein Bbelb_334070 [Branchiostoma belcheri]|nr:hypothetical protein Bbelb_334070 [Branchiostoma belcheri]